MNNIVSALIVAAVLLDLIVHYTLQRYALNVTMTTKLNYRIFEAPVFVYTVLVLLVGEFKEFVKLIIPFLSHLSNLLTILTIFTHHF